MKHTLSILIATGLLLAVNAVQAQDGAPPIFTVRMVEATNKGEDVDVKQLADVLPILRQNLRFNSYKVLNFHRQPLTSSNFAVALARNYRLSAIEVDQTELTVRLTRGREEVLKTRLRLRPNRPVILGGFPHGDVTLIIILKLQGQEQEQQNEQ